MSAIGTKRTSAEARDMSANDPKGVVTLSQTERNLPTTANVDARDFKYLACWLIVPIGAISLNVTTPSGMPSSPPSERQ